MAALRHCWLNVMRDQYSDIKAAHGPDHVKDNNTPSYSRSYPRIKLEYEYLFTIHNED